MRTPSKNGSAPLISVVLPVYNGEKYLVEAMDSILEQSFKDFELIVIDDGSTDSSIQILRKYEQTDNRVKLVSRANKGLPATLNEAVDEAGGQLIARMDQDDISLPDRLALQYQFMCDHPEVVALGCSAGFIDEEGKYVCTYIPPLDNATLIQIFPDSPFIHPSVMFRKNEFYKAGKYPEKMKWGGEDVILFGRFTKLGELRNLSEPLIRYRLVPGSMSRKPPKFRGILTSIVHGEIDGHSATNEQLRLLQQEEKKVDKAKALFDYYFEVAKLYIWSGGNRQSSQEYLTKCLMLRQSYAKVIIMYFIAYLPASWVSELYFLIKGRRYEKA